MNLGQWIIDTVRAPDQVAQRLMNLNLPRKILYEALLAVAALNALLASVPMLWFPLPDTYPAFLSQPFSFFIIVAGSLVVGVHLLFWAGRAMGGTGDLGDILILLVWLQFLRAVAQVALMVLTFAIPAIGGLMALGVSVYGIYLLVVFLKVGHRFGTSFAAFGLLALVFAGTVMILSVLLLLLGITPEGITQNV